MKLREKKIKLKLKKWRNEKKLESWIEKEEEDKLHYSIIILKFFFFLSIEVIIYLHALYLNSFRQIKQKKSKNNFELLWHLIEILNYYIQNLLKK